MDLSGLSLSGLIVEFLKSLTNASANTITTYRTALGKFIESGIVLDDSSLAAFDAYLAGMRYNIGKRKGGYSASTRYLYVVALKRFLEWLTAYDLAPTLNLAKAGARLKIG